MSKKKKVLLSLAAIVSGGAFLFPTVVTPAVSEAARLVLAVVGGS